jgi:hypothetical protein
VIDDPIVREILQSLGTGATVEMAEKAKAWHDAQGAHVIPPMPAGPPGIQPENLLGLAELTKLLEQPKPTVTKWATRDEYAFPAPVATLAATKVWDRDQVEVWMTGHPDLLV